MRVRCIDDHYSEEDKGDLISAILKVGDDHLLVKKGQQYNVIGFAHFTNGNRCYELEEINTLEYGYDKKLVFKDHRFEIVDTPFEPNAVDKSSGNLCRNVNFYMEGLGIDERGEYMINDKK